MPTVNLGRSAQNQFREEIPLPRSDVRRQITASGAPKSPPISAVFERSFRGSKRAGLAGSDASSGFDRFAVTHDALPPFCCRPII